jgi:3-isopropylmalate/(R)-2-methylmalate dehydratase small subunit
MKDFNGQVLFLDRSDINTDEIIPAKYLSEIAKEALRPHLLEDLKLNGFRPQIDIAHKRVVVTRANFGCGSSREHAPWALEVNHIHLVIAESFARIFKRNMFNCGMLAVELPKTIIDDVFATLAHQKTHLDTDLKGKTFTFRANDAEKKVSFAISDFERSLVEAGGWLEYADLKY